LRSSAPLTVLFTVSTFWKDLQKQRAAHGRADKPLEIHVVGASYPFEGRSDWALLANRKPAEVPGVRIVLVLGTPFQSDNVPPLEGQDNALLQNAKPAEGRWSNRREEIICKGAGEWGTGNMDKGWSKESLCGKHGDALEVVCLEKYYKDAKASLPKPDLVTLFSPGFPQLGRRSWDPELISMLGDGVPIMVSDVMRRKSWGRRVRQGNATVRPGARWKVQSNSEGEDWMTWLGMRAYGARRMAARRAPFPISHREEGLIFAKNGVVQLFQGYKTGVEPIAPPPTHRAARDATFLKSLARRREIPDEISEWLSVPASSAYERASRDWYVGQLRQLVRERGHSLTAEERATLEEYGLFEKRSKRRWSPRAWVSICKALHVKSGEVF